jgi:hypothetical protein
VAETTIAVEKSRRVSADPDKAWSLLASAAVWSLRPGFFAFDTVVPDSAPVRGLLMATLDGIKRGVLTLSAEQPAVAASWVLGRGSTFTFSVRAHHGGAVVAIALRRAVDATDRATTWAYRRRSERMLLGWLDGIDLVLAGRRPWPKGISADVRRACAAPPPLETTGSASALVLIAAPLDAVWEEISAPAKPVNGLVASGHVPGTPVHKPGEMQYFIHASDGQLALTAVILREVTYLRSAKTLAFHPPYLEMSYLLTGEPDATRLELTARFAQTALAAEPQAVRSYIAEYVRSAADDYKAVIEESWRAR